MSRPSLEKRPPEEVIPLLQAHYHAESISRKEKEKEKEKVLKRLQYAAKKDCLCHTVVTLRRRPGEDQVEPERRVCRAVATREGLCRNHYNRKFLKIRRRQFAEWQLPGNMSDLQHVCLAARPFTTTYEDCIEAMNAADPGNILKPIYEKPASRKSKA